MKRHLPRPTSRSLAVAATLAGLFCASVALAADSTPIDKASEQVSVALSVLKDVKASNKAGDEHLEKARAYLARARAELLKAQGQATPE
jgi:predicted nucleotidyltransferase